MTSPNFSVIYPNIYVYHNIIDNCEQIIAEAEEKEEWSDWFTFGKIIRGEPTDLYRSDSFPTKEEWESVVANEPREYYHSVFWAFFNATSHYVEHSKNSLDNWVFAGPSICKYDPNTNLHAEYAMHYHTDYQPERADFPGDKFGLTVTSYLNDTYSGGELLFKIKNPETGKIDSCSYKPSAGDIVVFPSREPYYHAVSSVHDDFKYFVRSFWDYYVDPSEEWIRGISEYGESDWFDMKNNEAKTKARIYGDIDWIRENLGVEVEW